MKTFDFVTTMSMKYYKECGYRYIDTFLRHSPPDRILHVWTEDGIPEHPQVKQYKLQDTDFYNNWTLTCKKPKVRTFSIKVGVQYEAAKILTGDVLVWIDADVYATQPLTDKFLNVLEPQGTRLANYMGQENNSGPETGILSYNRNHPNFKKFMEDFINVYYSGKIFNLTMPVDTFAWWEVKNTMPDEDFHTWSNSSNSHVFYVSELRQWIDHAKGQIKFKNPAKVDKRASTEPKK